MKHRAVKISDIAKHPNLSLSPRDYLTENDKITHQEGVNGK